MGGDSAPAGAATVSVDEGGCETGRGTSTVAARGARRTAPSGDRSTAAEGGAAADVVRGAPLAALPLRDAGADRGADLEALLFGEALDARAARDDFVAGSTESIAAMRSACVMPASSGGAPDVGAAARTPGGDAEPSLDAGAAPSVVRSIGFAAPAEAMSSGAGTPAGAGAPSTRVGFFSDSGVPSGARRTT
jgi:hypothetical protein